MHRACEWRVCKESQYCRTGTTEDTYPVNSSLIIPETLLHSLQNSLTPYVICSMLAPASQATAG